MQYTDNQIKELENKARQIRRLIVQMLAKAGSGHPGGSLSAADLITALFFAVLRHNPQAPNWPERDRFHLSKGHCCPLWYAVLAEAGYFPLEKLWTLRQLGSILQGHPDRRTPGVAVASGSLGQGLSVGLGMSLAAKIDQKDYRVYVLMGDGEQQEGQIWEAMMFASHNKVDNLISIVDLNGQQIDGPTSKVLSLGNLRSKFEAFDWTVLDMEGNDMDSVVAVLDKAKSMTGNGKPICILMKTEMGKGVDFMEGSHEWHGIAPSDEQLAKALAQLPETLGDY